MGQEFGSNSARHFSWSCSWMSLSLQSPEDLPELNVLLWWLIHSADKLALAVSKRSQYFSTWASSRGCSHVPQYGGFPENEWAKRPRQKFLHFFLWTNFKSHTPSTLFFWSQFSTEGAYTLRKWGSLGAILGGKWEKEQRSNNSKVG